MLLKTLKHLYLFGKNNEKKYAKIIRLANYTFEYSSSTSSFIERFYSIAGIVCEIRRSNMNDDLVTMRSMMKANMKLLTDLNKSFG